MIKDAGEKRLLRAIERAALVPLPTSVSSPKNDDGSTRVRTVVF
jgi:hypothetical protein